MTKFRDAWAPMKRFKRPCEWVIATSWFLFFFSHSVVHLLERSCSLFCCMTLFQPSFSNKTDGLILEYFMVTVNSIITRPPSPLAERTWANHLPYTAMLHSWCKVFVLIFYVCFLLNLLLCFMAKCLHFGLICPMDIVSKSLIVLLWVLHLRC